MRVDERSGSPTWAYVEELETTIEGLEHELVELAATHEESMMNENENVTSRNGEQKPKPPYEPTIAFPLVTSLAAKLCLEISRLEILASEIADEREKCRDALDGIRAISNGPRVDVALMLIRVESIVSAVDEQHSAKEKP